ncbi:hypothetical protein [Pseudactinotalea sp. Z1732]|uniref:hypothetical protein n=1 Tax=Micrococcales TaxID=85006 RepID=UPI003C79BED4
MPDEEKKKDEPKAKTAGSDERVEPWESKYESIRGSGAPDGRNEQKERQQDE